MKGTIYIGTSGWSYRDSNHVFYPPKMKACEYLSFYSKHFATTEINTSFYHMPRATSVKGWMDKVPGDFKFCPKISKYLTHIKRLKEPEEPLEKFFEVFEQMKPQMGPVSVQLPPSLKFDYDLAEHFYKVITTTYKRYDFAIEVRHDSWLCIDSLTLMNQYTLTLVISQSGVGFPYAEIINNKNIYVRFHGPGKLYASSYTDEMLMEYTGKFIAWQSQGHDVWVFFNNDWIKALNNAETLKAMLIKYG